MTKKKRMWFYRLFCYKEKVAFKINVDINFSLKLVTYYRQRFRENKNIQKFCKKRNGQTIVSND